MSERFLSYNELKALHKRVNTTPEEEWIASSGKTPLEFLSDVFRDPSNEIKDRISAAKYVLDYAHKKLPTESVVSGGLSLKNTLDTKTLMKLSDTDIESLMVILQKTTND